MSVLVVYRQKIWTLMLGCVGLQPTSSWPYILKLGLASVPAAIVGLGLQDWFEARFDDPQFAATMILVTGCFVWSSRWVRGPAGRNPIEWVPIAGAAVVAAIGGYAIAFFAVLGIEAALMATARATTRPEWHPEPSWSGALFMGVAQSVAILPGISRSGSTVITGLWRRIDPGAAAEFSFLMSIPAILGAAVLSLPDLASEGVGVPMPIVLLGAIAAGLSGVLAIRFFVALLKRQNFHAFAWYCWAAGGLYLLLS
jgi:undecaprenyl-diphosphatase